MNFPKIEKKFNVSIKSSKSSWFNGRAYFPLYNFKLNIQEKNWDIIINYENRVSEFQQKQYIDGGSFNDRHIYEVKLIPKSRTLDFPKFRISENGWLSRFFNKKKYICKSDDKILSKKIEKLQCLENYFLIGDSEFSPSISGRKENEKYIIKVYFNLTKNDEDVLLLTIDCLSKIANIIGIE